MTNGNSRLSTSWWRNAQPVAGDATLGPPCLRRHTCDVTGGPAASTARASRSYPQSVATESFEFVLAHSELRRQGPRPCRGTFGHSCTDVGGLPSRLRRLSVQHNAHRREGAHGAREDDVALPAAATGGFSQRCGCLHVRGGSAIWAESWRRAGRGRCPAASARHRRRQALGPQEAACSTCP